jgi:hypothetical protein
LGSETTWLAYRKVMASQVDEWTLDNRLSCFYDAVLNCHSSSTIVFCSVENWQLESLLLGFYVGMVFLEDFLWFVLDPYYGIKNFRKGKIWWHRER